MVTALTSLLILKVHTLEIIRILIFIPPLSVFQSILEPPFKEQLSRSKQSAASMESAILPLALILIRFIECKYSISTTLPFFKDALIVISILIVGLSFAMGLIILPIADVFHNLIITLGFGNERTFPIEGSIFKFAFIPGVIGEGINSMTTLLIILPITSIDVIIGISILPISMLVLPPHCAFIAISIPQILNRHQLCLHFLSKNYKISLIPNSLLNVCQQRRVLHSQ
jgi:hypothetical protein